jgi:protein-S-isoprenylcysteine O-methyltransferase Ste14
VLGAAFSTWTNLTWAVHLRREAGVALSDPVLLSAGPYKSIRYPSLLYLIFYCLGFAILFRSWIGLALIIPLIAAILYRIRHLEAAYARQYKKVWPLRCRTSWRIIPYLY